jgi:hypothetical protein
MPRSSAFAPSVAHSAFASDHIVALFTVALALAAPLQLALLLAELLAVLLAVAAAAVALLLPPFTCKRVRMTSRGFVSSTCDHDKHKLQRKQIVLVWVCEHLQY